MGVSGRNALLLPLMALASCSQLRLRVDEPLDPARIEALEVGRTRRGEVLAALGPPAELAAHGEGHAFLYQSIELVEDQLGFSLKLFQAILPGIELVKLSFGNSDAHHQAAVLVFGPDGILRDKSYGAWEEVFGRGAALQFLFTVEQVVDSGSLRDRAAPLGWGLLDCEALPEALNEPRRADLELRGTGVLAGQRSVEMRRSGPRKKER